MTPIVKYIDKPFLEQFQAGVVKIQSDPVQHILYLGRKCCTIFLLHRISHVAHFFQHKRQIWQQGIPPPFFKFFRQVVIPVGPLQFHAVAEHGPEVVSHETYLLGQYTG